MGTAALEANLHHAAQIWLSLEHMPLRISLILTVIAAFSSPVIWGLFWYTLSLKYPTDKTWGIQVRWVRCPLNVTHQSLLKLLQARESFGVWDVACLVGTIVHLDLSFCVVTVMPQIPSVLPHSTPYSQFEISHFRLQINIGRWCHYQKLLPKLLFCWV